MSSTIGIGVPIPKMLPITGTWTLPFATYFLFLTNRIVYRRLRNEHYFGETLPSSAIDAPKSDEQDLLQLETRAQSNFLENVPLAFIFAAVAELNGADRKVLNWLMAGLLVLRISHAELGLKRKGSMGLGRPVGYYGTQAIIGGLAGWGSYLVKGYWGY